MNRRTNWRFRTTVAVATILFGAIVGGGQTQQMMWEIEVLLNGKPLMTGHTHVTPEKAGIDESCISFRSLEKLLGGAKYVARQGSDVNAVKGRDERNAVFRVQRGGRISSNAHRMGDEWYITLGDLVRALGARVVRERSDRFDLVLKRSAADSILGLSEPAGAIDVAGQTQQMIWDVEVLLNGKRIMAGHSHVAPEKAGIDEICISFRGVEKLLGGPKYLVRRGSDVNAIEGRPAKVALFRVERAGRISSNAHRMGDEWYIMLGDLVRALRAKVIREKPDRFDLVLNRSASGAVLGLNK